MQAEQQKTITISIEEHNELLNDQLFLNCLQDCGVDNWEGYDFAVEEYNNALKIEKD